MSLVRAGTMYGEVFGAMTEMKNKKEQQRDICAATNFHPYGGNYCDSASAYTLYEILTLYDLLTLPSL